LQPVFCSRLRQPDSRARVEAELAGVSMALSSAGHGRPLHIGLSMGRRN
jgi:hypothetical protein